jgi:hypothetical protein
MSPPSRPLRPFLALSACALLAACASTPDPVAPRYYNTPYPALREGMTQQQGNALREELRRANIQIQSLSADIARLREDVCVMAQTVNMLDVRRDPVSGRNRVLAKDGAVPASRRCP